MKHTLTKCNQNVKLSLLGVIKKVFRMSNSVKSLICLKSSDRHLIPDVDFPKAFYSDNHYLL